jgi:hypothetical protein
MDQQELEEIRALRDADTLHMLPPEALIASIKYLAEKVLELQHRLSQVSLAVTNPDRDHVDRCVDVLGIVG